MKSTVIEYIELKQFNFRAIKDALFHVAFHGAFGNFWSALMKIPQVKQFYASDLHFQISFYFEAQEKCAKIDITYLITLFFSGTIYKAVLQ